MVFGHLSSKLWVRSVSLSTSHDLSLLRGWAPLKRREFQQDRVLIGGRGKTVSLVVPRGVRSKRREGRFACFLRHLQHTDVAGTACTARHHSDNQSCDLPAVLDRGVLWSRRLPVYVFPVDRLRSEGFTCISLQMFSGTSRITGVE